MGDCTNLKCLRVFRALILERCAGCVMRKNGKHGMIAEMKLYHNAEFDPVILQAAEHFRAAFALRSSRCCRGPADHRERQ
jgi:hypothetical protein